MVERGIPLDVGLPRPEDGKVLESIKSLNWTFYHTRPQWAPGFADGAETSFVLPITSQELYLISRGSYQGGKVQVKQSTEQGDVRVDVRVAYHDTRALARATLSQLRKGGNRNGVGIFTPTGWSDPTRDRLVFDVVFTFPAAASTGPLHVNALTFLTSNFAHEFGNLWKSIRFENVELGTSNAPIRIDSITLNHGSFTTSNGPIVGHFNTSDALVLHTSNAHIQATASLLNTRQDPTQLDMRTSNGAITSSISLIGDASSHFSVKARTNNAAVKLRYDESPAGAHLISDVRSSNSPVSAVMHPAYEGSFELSTSNGRPVVRDTKAVDPTGKGRRRVVDQTTTNRGMISGRVYWGRREGEEGKCMLHTSNAGASLDL